MAIHQKLQVFLCFSYLFSLSHHSSA
ncbi:hypothetical protein RDI58_005367 [Solanum bulbocastanum]|uniref:Uncharacterized protein n=1 Tax=Solanum bulbocastanum TaxID=147425 RepID=A0AAN8YMD1_SOLBU